MEIGVEQIVDCYNNSFDNLDNVEFIRNLMHKVTKVIDHTIISETYYHFSPQGITGIAIISASHIAIHTWPELNYISIDIFSCYHSKPIDMIIKLLKNEFSMTGFQTKTIKRSVNVD